MRTSLAPGELIDIVTVAKILCDLRILGTAIPTVSAILQKDDSLDVEHGFIVCLYSIEKTDITDKIWPTFQSKFPSIKCAHIKDSEGSSCCIFDYNRPSLCPFNQRQ